MLVGFLALVLDGSPKYCMAYGVVVILLIVLMAYGVVVILLP